MRMIKWTGAAGCALVALTLSGCNREASGQVAAVVNGEEITLQEINTEIGDAQLPANVDRKAIQQAALQRIIDRRLIAQTARDDGIDKDPAFLARQRQVVELLLIQMYTQKAARTLRVPEGATIDKYMAANPGRFGERSYYLVDRIQFPVPKNPKLLEQLRDDHTMEAVAAKLTSLGITFNRGNAQFDSATVAPALLAKIKALPPGEPFVLPDNGGVTVAAVTGSKVVPLVGADARPVAVQAMRNEEMKKLLDERVKTTRAAAKIEYQAGFAPTAKESGSPKSAAPAK